MHILRTSLTLTRLVLAWFMLTVGVAVASPVISPQTLVLLCSHEGRKAVVIDADGQVVTASQASLDCPLCLPVVGAPPAPYMSLPAPVSTFAAPLHFSPSRYHAPAGAPLPARGPPARA
ncbi:DUF2946 domain-containing protein [Massilia sp. G4R7]|uniref:DUF2946 domain-containing protein n=1 Tax=Massilia phyllostachyos TaxID=2898585 RepID=A0ABS8Q0U8_9BURK|nr:DUF2946 domain-containing protein [Massilia phyllostachyos]MCD2515372.1 DUF2946 domain-containing protein [Massilia phyllostachyos]